MATPQPARAERDERITSALADLRARGLRMTPQRRSVLEAVFRARGHVTADEILTTVRRRFPDINLSTVYRNLAVLEDAGVLSHSHLGHSAGVFHPAEGKDHQHLICRTCGATEEHPIEVLDAMADTIRRSSGFEVDLTHVALYGTCKACADAE